MRTPLAVTLALSLLFSIGRDRPTASGAFSSWHPCLISDSKDAHLKWLEFNSPVLGGRVSNAIIVPDGYASNGPALPVAYFLHGGGSENEVLDFSQTVSGAPKLIGGPDPISTAPCPKSRGGGVGGEAQPFRTHADAAHFLTVVVDRNGWCAGCNWINGRNGKGIAAEHHIYNELIPLVQHMLPARPDRGGRAIVGHSMGGYGTLVQGVRHPDYFSFIGAFSGDIGPSYPGDLDAFHAASDAVLWLLYMRAQGYGDPKTDEIHYANMDVGYLASDLIGTNAEVMITTGDGCLPTVPPVRNAVTGYCGPLPVSVDNPTDPIAHFRYPQENGIRQMTMRLVPALVEQGVPTTFIPTDGEHGIKDAVVRDSFIPRMNTIFAGPVPDPYRFSYKTVDRNFTIWHYRVQVSARRNEEFLHLLGARTDGMDLTLAGTGVVRITLPTHLRPGRAYRVDVTPAGLATQHRSVVADGSGHLTIAGLDLGPQSAVDQRTPLTGQGFFQFPQTKVSVIP